MNKEAWKDQGYTGADTLIVIPAKEIPVAVGEAHAVYGVPCLHEVVKGEKQDETGEKVECDVHILSATVPKQLADEMVKVGRAHLRSDAVKGEKSDTAKASKGMNVEQLRAALTEKEIEFSDDAKKPALAALLDGAE